MSDGVNGNSEQVCIIECIIEFSVFPPDTCEHTVVYMSQWVCSVCSLALRCSSPRSHYLPSPTLFSVTQKNHPPHRPFTGSLLLLFTNIYTFILPLSCSISLLHCQSASRGHTVARAVSPPVPLSSLWGTFPLQLYRSVNRC